ncbi:hypothetical protein BJX76DRAFT_357607 [Aspergillus varians]
MTRPDSQTTEGADVAASMASRDRLTTEKTDDKPWKYIVFPGYVTYVSSDTDLSYFQKFNRLNEDINNGNVCDETRPDRMTLLKSAQEQLKKYNQHLLSYTQLRARGPVKEKNIRSLRMWHKKNHPKAISAKEAQYIEQNDLTPRL